MLFLKSLIFVGTNISKLLTLKIFITNFAYYFDTALQMAYRICIQLYQSLLLMQK